MFLGIDIGTSGVKAAVLDEGGAIRATSQAPLTVSRPSGLWSEQEPADWWGATGQAVALLPADVRYCIKAIGLSGQMHGATLLGADDKPLRPAILWNDGRSGGECAELEALVPDSRRITGNLAMPGFTAPKLMWLRRYEPEVFNQVRTVLLPKDYVRLCMTGDKASDLSDASGTLWLDVAARDWSEEMLAASSLSCEHMPALFEGSDIAGTLRGEVAQEWGMARVPVAAGGGDNAAGAIGVGLAADGDALLSLGTSGVIFAATQDLRPNPERAIHAFCHCVPGMWHQMAVHLSAASCLEWAAALTGAGGADKLVALAEEAGAASGPELFLPYLSGERTPHNDPDLRGAFLGLGYDSGPKRLAVAVLEGVAFALADGLAALRDAGTVVDSLTVIGGGARSPFWGSIIASALDVRLDYVEGGDFGPALGAARLAMMAVTGANAAEACTRPPVLRSVEPLPELADRLAPKQMRFRAAYSTVRAI